MQASSEIPAAPAAARRSGLLEFIVKAAVTAGLLAFLFAKLDLKATAHQLASAGPGAFVLGTAIILLLSLLVSLRWQLILEAMNNPLGFLPCWRLVMVGLFFNQTLPSSIGGDAVRILMTARLTKSFRAGLVSVALDRLFALIALCACVAVALPLLLKGPAAALAVLVMTMAVLGTLGLFFFDTAAARLSPLASRLAGARVRAVASRPLDLLRESSRVFGLILRRPAASFVILGTSVVNQLALGVIVYVMARALGTNLSLSDALLVFPLAMLVSMVPISLGGWGVREASMVWLLGSVGICPQEAVSISILFGLVNTASGLPGGVLWLLGRRSERVRG